MPGFSMSASPSLHREEKSHSEKMFPLHTITPTSQNNGGIILHETGPYQQSATMVMVMAARRTERVRWLEYQGFP